MESIGRASTSGSAGVMSSTAANHGETGAITGQLVTALGWHELGALAPRTDPEEKEKEEMAGWPFGGSLEAPVGHGFKQAL